HEQFAERFAPIASLVASYGTAFDDYIKARELTTAMESQSVTPARDHVRNLCMEHRAASRAAAGAAGKETTNVAASARTVSVWMGIGSLLLGAGMGFFIVRSITRPVRSLIGRIKLIQD